jgi:hypothetical protein
VFWELGLLCSRESSGMIFFGSKKVQYSPENRVIPISGCGEQKEKKSFL